MQIKKEYSDILEKLGVLDKYKANIIKYCEGRDMNVAKYIIATNSWDGFGSFLRNSFIWKYTPEHDEFWRNIAKKGVDLWNK